MTMVTLPGIMAMFGGFFAAGLTRKIGRKSVGVGSLFIMLAGGLTVRFWGMKSLLVAVIGSAATGFSAGTIPSALYAAYGAITPSGMRDKVVGWSDAITSIGIIIPQFLSGILASDGNWARAFDYYFILIPIIVVLIMFFPSAYTALQNQLDRRN